MGRESHVVELMARPMSESAAPAADQESVSIHMLTWGMAQLTCEEVLVIPSDSATTLWSTNIVNDSASAT